MECVILYRNPGSGGVGYVSDGESDKIMVYTDHDAALRDVPNVPVLRAWPYQIVVLDEL